MIISSATANPVLTATLQKFYQDQAGFVGLSLMPLFLTGQQSAKYYVFDKENTIDIPRNLNRAPSSPYKRTMLKLSDDSYSCTNKGIEIPVDDEEREKYAAAFSADEAAMKRAANIIRMNHEIRVRDLIANNANSTGPAAVWDDYTDSLSAPVGDVDGAKESIKLACGLEANLMVIARDVYLKLKEHPKILDKIKYSQRGVMTVEILQEIFGISQIIIAGAIENSAAEGQAVSPDYLWSGTAFLGHCENSSDLQAPNFGRTFAWTAQTSADGILVESYREDEIQSDIHRAKQHTDEKITGSELGFLLSGLLT